ncbi:RagB/SusD family nutrient uptake outer membrane protein [Olivibacter sp. CPCC 100613]|uniref:RagB/SusD family nutrient uptake outer membrane protein n=1 Tax=Olivibacter sp. CPCC 100613 TaxID=3079931 RepID=UPI002FF991AE
MRKNNLFKPVISAPARGRQGLITLESNLIQMKKIKKYRTLLLMLTGLLLSSCEKFLEENNQSSLTEDPFYNTEAGITSAVNACYSGLRLWYGKEHGMGLSETGTDLFLRGGDNKANQISDYTVDLNGGQTNIKDMWDMYYRALNVCNTALARLPQSPLTETLKQQYLGEVHFLRAFYLFQIVQIWGGVVLNTSPTEGVVTTAKRSTEEDFYEVINSDLNTAIKNLKEGKSTNGRITQDVAKGLLARVCLTQGSQYQNQAKYLEAATLAKELINSGRYALFEDYKSLWDMGNAEGGSNSEVVFYVNYTNDDLLNGDFEAVAGKGNNSHLHFIMVYDRQEGLERSIAYGRPFQRFMPSLHLLQLFDPVNDQRYDGSFQTVWFANKAGMQKGDSQVFPEMAFGDTAVLTRRDPVTIEQANWAKSRYRIYDRNNLYRADGTPALRSQFIQLSKFMDPTRLTVAQEWSARDVFVIRLAELYLIAAEASLQSNPTEALNLINTLRHTRAKVGKEQAMEVKAADLDIDFILEERARELAGEQIRWFDLKRTHKLIPYVQQFNPDAKNNIKEYHQVRPIPQSQLDAILNKEEFKQNPGYN